MKKILCTAAAVIISVCTAVSVLASSSSVMIKNNNSSMKPVTYTYSSESSGQIVKSVKTLMTELSELSRQNKVVQTITVSSDSEVPVDFKLRLELEGKNNDEKPEPVSSTPSPEEYKALNYYNLKITDASGNVMYDFEDDKSEDNGEPYKEFPLGVLNNELKSENRVYNITISINKELNTREVAKAAEKLDWCISSDTMQRSEPAVTVTAAPAQETAAATEPPEKPSEGVKEDKNGVVTLSKGEYLCGRDIDEGKYVMTGNGKVHVYTSEGVLKTTIALKDKKDKDANGVDEYVINLIDGEKVTVETDTKFTPYKAAKATASPKAASSAKSSGSSSKNSSKTNPKTGDSAPLAAACALMVLSLGAIVFVEIKKRKNNH